MSYQYKRQPLTSEQLRAYEGAVDTMTDKLITYTLVDLGLRVSELAGLQRVCVDWQGQRITIFGKGGPYGRHSKRRVLPLTIRTAQVLGHVFSVCDRVKLSKRTIQRRVKSVARRAGLVCPVSPHVLRHTFAVNCLRRGVSLPTIMRLLGHENLLTTQAYLNLSPEMVISEFREKFRDQVE